MGAGYFSYRDIEAIEDFLSSIGGFGGKVEDYDSKDAYNSLLQHLETAGLEVQISCKDEFEWLALILDENGSLIGSAKDYDNKPYIALAKAIVSAADNHFYNCCIQY